LAKTETIRARVQPEPKREAEPVFRALGLSASEAITLFYRQVTLRRGLPFLVELPNEATREAMRQGLAGEDLSEWDDLEVLKAAHG
jgi:DNA-damage-inducible protein J